MADVIDTLEIAHELRDAGVPERQAEAIARQFKRRYEADRAELVTRAYLDHALERHAVELRAELERHMAELRAELAGQRVESKAELDRHVASSGPSWHAWSVISFSSSVASSRSRWRLSGRWACCSELEVLSARDATWCPCRRTWQGHRMRAGHLQD